MSSREQILARIARRLGPRDSSAVQQRLQQPPLGPIPARAAALPAPQQVELFCQMAQEAAAQLHTLSELAQLPALIAQISRSRDLVVSAPLAELAWSAAGLTVAVRRAQDSDRVTVSCALAGIAETGSLVLISGADNPSTLNFLPDQHIVLVRAADIVPTAEAAWSLWQTTGQALPRTMNFITGPSRSADIEQTLQMGAHGPIELHIVLLGAAPT